MECKKRIAIIGGGFSGMTSIAILKEEPGLEPICFEKMDQPGGTWYYRDIVLDGVPSIMKTTIINHSKEMGAYSNFPPRKTYNNYMRHNEMYEYFKEYWIKNDCLKHVRCNMEVTEVRRAKNYEKTGSWVVSVKNTVTGEESTDTYDGVMLCIGIINRPKMAQYPGQETFKGKIMHSHSLKEADSQFRDKKVLVVGTGCSALDAAVETSGVAKQVYLSTKSGAYVMNRVGPNGYPLDYKLLRRYLTNFLDILPSRICSWYVEKYFINPKFDKRLYNVKPQYHILSKDPVISDHFASKLLSGSVIQKGDIEKFTENGVVFIGEEDAYDIDIAIMATGYDWKFPFLESGIITREDGMINLYKCMYPPQLIHPTLAVIGFFLPYGPLFPLAEQQCRLAAQIYSGKRYLPSEKRMMKDIKQRHYENEKRFAPSPNMTIKVDYVQYMDEVSSLIGAKPNFFKLFFTDPRLYFKLYYGPAVPYQYRLKGPHKWDGARNAIMTCSKRVKSPLLRDCAKYQ